MTTNRLRPLFHLLVAGWACALPAAEPPVLPPDQRLDYMIVVTGSELLEGVYPDGHTHFLTRALLPLGGHCVGSITVDDRAADLKLALRFASGKAPLLIVTGGLGPTGNDITRGVLAEYTGIKLAEHPQVITDLEQRFKEPRDQLRPNLRRQAQIPVQGTFLRNRNGTAAGLVFESPEAVLVALPGPPKELQPMVRDELVPYLRQRFGLRPPGASLTLRFIGAGQSLISQTIQEKVTLPPEITLTSVFEGGRVDFTLSMPIDSPETRAQLRTLGDQVRAALSDYCYGEGDTSLEQVVIARLRARNLSLALVEIGSRGSLAAALNGIEGAEAVVAGAFSAPTTARIASLLGISDADLNAATTPDAKLQLLARRAAAQTRSPWVVVTGELQADAEGRPGVRVALHTGPDEWDWQWISFRDSGEVVRSGLTTPILDRWRKRLAAGQPAPKMSR